MGTTLVIVELLIIGFQVLIWVGLLLAHFNAIPGWSASEEPKGLLKQVVGCDTLLVAFLVGTAYTLGIVWDRLLGLVTTLSGLLMRCVTHKWRPKRHRGTGEDKTQEGSRNDENDVIEDFYANYIYQPHAYEVLENATRQKRLLRATGVNSIIIAFMVCAWQGSNYRVLSILLFSVGGASLLTWMSSFFKQNSNLAKAAYAVRGKKSADSKALVAANATTETGTGEEKPVDQKEALAPSPQRHTLTRPATEPTTASEPQTPSSTTQT